MYSNNNILASETWVNNQYYLTSSPSQLTVGKLMGNPIVSWASKYCYIQCLSTTGNNWLTFRANNTITDGTILCTPGTSGVGNSGTLSFYCNEAVFNSAISAGYAAYNKLLTSMPGYDTHRWTFNCRGFDTMYTQSNYNGAIMNTLNGTVNMPGTCNDSNLTVNNDFICNSGIIMVSSSIPQNMNFIGYTSTMKLTNSIALPSGYTLFFTYSTPVSGTFSFDAQLRLEYVVGQANWNTVIFGISTAINYFDSECYYNAFERNPRADGTRGTECLHTRRVLYITSATPVYLLVNFAGGVGNFATASNAFTFLRYTRIA